MLILGCRTKGDDYSRCSIRSREVRFLVLIGVVAGVRGIFADIPGETADAMTTPSPGDAGERKGDTYCLAGVRVG